MSGNTTPAFGVRAVINLGRQTTALTLRPFFWGLAQAVVTQVSGLKTLKLGWTDNHSWTGQVRSGLRILLWVYYAYVGQLWEKGKSVCQRLSFLFFSFSITRSRWGRSSTIQSRYHISLLLLLYDSHSYESFDFLNSCPLLPFSKSQALSHSPLPNLTEVPRSIITATEMQLILSPRGFLNDTQLMIPFFI